MSSLRAKLRDGEQRCQIAPGPTPPEKAGGPARRCEHV